MNLPDEYRRQFRWRDWQTAIRALPAVTGQTLLDLGCGVGDLAAELAASGAARVIAVDVNDELIRYAESRGLENVEFHSGDVRTLPDFGVAADGIWCSFMAAYFPDLPPVLSAWMPRLKIGGWIALTEIDDLFGHRPLSDRATALLDAYAEDSLRAGRYDFRMGRKLARYTEQCGFAIVSEATLPDSEFSFAGPASSEVVDAWRLRFERMRLLHAFCGSEFESVRDEFLACLSRPDHRSDAAVRVCIGRLPAR